MAWRLLALLVPGTALAVVPGFTHMAVAKVLWAAMLLALVGVLALWERRWWGQTVMGPEDSDERTPPELGAAGALSRAEWMGRPHAGVIALGLALLLSVPALLRWDNDWTTFRQVVLGLLSLVLLFHVAVCRSPQELREWLERYLLVAALVIVALWGAERQGWVEGIAAVPGGATLGNPGLVGEFAALIALVALLRLPRSSRAGKLVLVAAAAALVVSVVGSGSLTGSISLLAGLFTFWIGSRNGSKRIAFVAGVAVAVAAVAALLLWPELQQGVERRLYLYRIAWDVVADSPWFGHGLGSFARQFLERQGDWLAAHPQQSGWFSFVDSAHNVWLQLAAERGIPMALLFAAFVGWVASRFWRQSKWAELSVWVALVVCVSGGIGFESVTVRLFFFGWAGFAFGPTAGSTDAATFHREIRSVSWRRRGTVAAFSLLLLLPASYLAWGDSLVGAGRFEEAGDLPPCNAQALFGRALAREKHDDLEGAAEDLRAADACAPGIAARMELGRVLYRQGIVEKAEHWWLAVIQWHRRFMPAYANLAVLYAETGRPVEARRYFLRAQSLRPSDPRVLQIRQHLKRLGVNVR